ncbi:MAG TPA: Xaa-Pro peptidase family protein [Methylomirabilota bacterium]|jgi:Xaa-Pro aminopeptidase
MYPHQVDRLTTALQGAGLEALVAVTPANVRYITGFLSPRGAPHSRPFAVFSRRGTALVVEAADAPSIVTDAVPVDHIVCFGSLALAPPDRPTPQHERLRVVLDARCEDPTTALAHALDMLEVRRERVGVDEAGVPAPLWTRLAEGLSPRTIVPASEQIRAARRVKSPYEIECLERALHIAEEALNQLVQVIKPGLTEREASGIYEAEVRKRGAETSPAIVAFGEHSAIPRAWPTDRALRAGEVARFDLGCVFKGYHASVARTAIAGAPDERQQRPIEAVEAGVEAALDAIRPAVAAARVHQAALEAARKSLPDFRADQVGSGIGLEPNEAPMLAEGSLTPLEVGEVLCVDLPYWALGRDAVHLRETALVTTRGYHVLNRSARGVIVLD